MLVETEKLCTKNPNIIQAVLKIFVEKGIDGTTIQTSPRRPERAKSKL